MGDSRQRSLGRRDTMRKRFKFLKYVLTSFIDGPIPTLGTSRHTVDTKEGRR